jgi:hypothetical protein
MMRTLLGALPDDPENVLEVHVEVRVRLMVELTQRPPPYEATKKLRIVTFGISGGRSLTRLLRDARRFPLTF